MGGCILKRPITLLIAVVISVIALSIMFPTGPGEIDIISRIRLAKEKPAVTETVKEYKIDEISRLSDSGNAIAWSHDEKSLYCSAGVQDTDDYGLEDLYLFDLQGNKKKINSKIKLYNISDAKWSSDFNMLAFISTHDEKSSLIIYDVERNAMKDITPKNVLDVGVTSYDWDNESLNIIMSVDISNPRIEIYNLKSGKSGKLDISLKECRNVSFFTNGKIIFSANDGNKYKIYEADMYGKNVVPITEGWDFNISPDRHKLSILSDGDGQRGLWIYDMTSHEKSGISVSPIYEAYWLDDSTSLMYSIELDSRNTEIYKGTIYCYGKDGKTTNVSGAIYTRFVPSLGGNKIAMISPESYKVKKEDKGIFIGNIYR